ncbi:MAG: IgGFc-binding protein [Flavobacteriales bacterium]
MATQQDDMIRHLDLYLTADVSTTAIVSLPLQGWSTTEVLSAGITSHVQVPVAMGMNSGSNVVEPRGVHISSLDTITVIAHNYEDHAADGTCIYPAAALGNEYRVMSYGGFVSWPSEFLIVAAHDGTGIEITPTVATVGHQAGVPYTITLDQGQSYQVQSASASEDLTGTLITGLDYAGSCTPFAVFAGTACAVVPAGCSACEHLYEQMLPVELWGSSYVGAPWLGTTSVTYRIMSNDDDRVVTINGGTPITLNAGGFYEFQESGGVCIDANGPICAAQFMESISCGSWGDPSLVLLNANDRSSTGFTFQVPEIAGPSETYFVTIIVEVSQVGNITVDGDLIQQALFQTFANCTSKAYALVPLTLGQHTISCPAGLIAYLSGAGLSESYSWSLGTASTQSFSDSQGPVIIATGSQLHCTATGSAYQWFLNGEPISGATAQDHMALSAGTYTVEMDLVPGCSAVSAPYVLMSVNVDELQLVDMPIQYDQSSGTIMIKYGSDAKVRMYTITGQLLFEVDVKGAVETRLPAVGSGLRLVELSGPSGYRAYRHLVTGP